MALTVLQKQRQLAIIALVLVLVWFIVLLAAGGIVLAPVALISTLATPAAVALLAYCWLIKV